MFPSSCSANVTSLRIPEKQMHMTILIGLLSTHPNSLQIAVSNWIISQDIKKYLLIYKSILSQKNSIKFWIVIFSLIFICLSFHSLWRQIEMNFKNPGWCSPDQGCIPKGQTPGPAHSPQLWMGTGLSGMASCRLWVALTLRPGNTYVHCRLERRADGDGLSVNVI